jgi:hypothetical protein
MDVANADADGKIQLDPFDEAVRSKTSEKQQFYKAARLVSAENLDKGRRRRRRRREL